MKNIDDNKCIICNNSANIQFLNIKEKMFGTGEVFHYFQCENCKTIQICEIPNDIGKYYPDEYYIYVKTEKEKTIILFKYFVINNISLIIRKFYRLPYFTEYSITFADRKKAILDIGCGNGRLIHDMKLFGFKNLTGIDPFIKKPYKTKDLKILKQNIFDHHCEYDIIMSHHSLEHMYDPNSFFCHVKKILKKNGKLIIRIPIVPNYIWDKYFTDWIQLDPPRHIFTFSIQSIEILCEKFNFKICSIKYDAAPWAFASTEYCKNGGSHIDFLKNRKIEARHQSECKQANENKNGDSVIIVIEHH